jgi:hypothetical protein
LINQEKKNKEGVVAAEKRRGRIALYADLNARQKKSIKFTKGKKMIGE